MVDVSTVTVIGAVAVGIIGAIATGSVRIIKEINNNGRALVAGQEAQQARGEVRDQKVQQIHVLVNSRLLTVLRLLVTVTKKEAERTGAAADLKAYRDALAELQHAEDTNRIVADQTTLESDTTKRADVAEARAVALRAAIHPRPS